MFFNFWPRSVRSVMLALLFSFSLTFPVTAVAAGTAAFEFALRNHNPFLQIFGLPPLQSAAVVPEGETQFAISLDLANNADFGETETENFFIDGESYFVNLTWRRRVRSWLELGVDVPLVAHSGGFMDNAIINWHDLLSMSNTKRRGPKDEVRFFYERDGSAPFDLASSASGVGDLQMNAAIPLKRADKDGFDLTVRTSLKLPTGDDRKLLGSGAADLATGLYVTKIESIFDHTLLGLSAFAGVILLGDGDVLPDIQESAVPFGGIGVSWMVSERLSITTQLQAQGTYFNSEIDELGGTTFQLGVGFGYRLRDSNRCLKFAVVEDVTADATTDFALHFGFNSRCAP